jgi:hypothetical protein
VPPTSTPTPTDTPIAFPTVPVTPTAVTPIPVVPARCGPPGVANTTMFTNANGIVGSEGQIVYYNAVVSPQYPVVPSFETITGRFLIDLNPVAGVHMLTTFHFPSGDTFCDTGITDSSGTATCTLSNAGAVPGTPVTVDTSFIYNCGQFSTTTQFNPIGPLTPVPTAVPSPTPVPFIEQDAPPGVCVTQQGFGDLYISASFVSTINTQPSLSAGPFLLGVFTASENGGLPGGIFPGSSPTPTATGTPTETPTETATPTETSTPVPTETATPTPPPPTATSTPTPTKTPTPPPAPLKFSLDSAKVTQHIANDGCKTSGLDTVTYGQSVCLELFYTIDSMPKSESRVTTYDVLNATGQVVYGVSFQGTESKPASLPFRQARYAPVTVSSALPYGVYHFRATLKLDSQTQTRTWTLAIVRGPSATTSRQFVNLTTDVQVPGTGGASSVPGPGS